MHDPTEQVKISITWPLPPSVLSLQHRMVHVWGWDYECSTDDLHRCTMLLSLDERLTMQRFHFEKDRVRYCVSHAILRILLGQYLDLEPMSLYFEQNEFGKPSLPPALAIKLTFNMSHTHHVALLAVASGLKVGVDVEEIRPVERETVEHYFSAREQADLASLTGAAWLEGFYDCWTRKEAILKAEGVGLNVKLDAFDVSLRPNVKAEVLKARPDAGFTSSWHLTELRPASGTAGALATDAAPASVNCYRFSSAMLTR
jgi:4'-phosphopantetheinyl transferase